MIAYINCAKINYTVEKYTATIRSEEIKCVYRLLRVLLALSRITGDVFHYNTIILPFSFDIGFHIHIFISSQYISIYIVAWSRYTVPYNCTRSWLNIVSLYPVIYLRSKKISIYIYDLRNCLEITLFEVSCNLSDNISRSTTSSMTLILSFIYHHSDSTIKKISRGTRDLM